MTRLTSRFLTLLIATLALTACSGGWDPHKEDRHNQAAWDTVREFKESDPSMQRFFDEAYGWAVFPTIGKGAIGIGGAYGRGRLFVNGDIVGSTSMTQGSIGFQWGGQAYSEIIFFGTREALDRFMAGSFELGAHASAVAATLGAGTSANFHEGVAVFTLVRGGLMYEAAVGGQAFTFTPF